MKKALITLLLVITIFGIFSCTNKIYAAQQVLDNRVEGQLVEIKEKEAKSLEDYKQKYGSDAYGTVAYILNLVRIWSIPLCFLGIAVGAIHKYVIGIRKLDVRDKGFNIMIAIITVLVICQILPLIFAIIVKGWRG